MSFSSFRDRPRLSDRLRGKSGDELFKELRKELDNDRKLFFDSPSSSPTSNWGSQTGSTFPRAGHLFEEPLMRGHTDIRSHLEDLAHRHPEFADQLRYPAWTSTPDNHTWGRKRRGSGQHEASEASKQQQTTQEPQSQEQSEQPPPENNQGPECDPLRGRAKENLRNTVPDMGQKQQETDKDSRGQRSWSAPPDNRSQQAERPRFVSKIEIHPVNPDAPTQPQAQGDATKPPMAPPKPQPQQKPQHKQSTVHHIPIFVEGRDEPVLPRNVEPEFTQSQAPPQQHYTRPPPPPQHQQHNRQQTHEQHQQQQQSSHPEPKQQQPELQPEPPVNPRDPLYRVSLVQKDVDELRGRVDSFSGSSRTDKEYLVLDELLTRNLIKLDDIETEGKEEVRAARKNTIRSIQKCISDLENKVPIPGSEKKEEAMDVEQQTEKQSEASGENTNQETSPPSENKQMEVEAQPQNSQEANLAEANPASSAEEKKTEAQEAPPPGETADNKA